MITQRLVVMIHTKLRICCVLPLLGGCSSQNHDAAVEDPAEAIARVGGTVERDGLGLVSAVTFPRSTFADAHLDLLAALPKLRSLNLLGTDLTDESCARLKDLVQLEELNLTSTGVGDVGVSRLRGLSKLRVLYLEDTYITDAGLRDIAKLQNLEVLALHRTGVTNEGLKYLADLKHLETLYLIDLPITDDGLVHLEKLESLRDLYIGANDGVTEAGEQKLKTANPQIGIY